MTEQPTSKPTCPSCGAEVPPDAPRGYCLICLFTLGTTEPDSVVEGPTDQSAIRNPQSAIRSRSFGDYELLEEIARGGMGVVYKARQKSLGRIVAVKMLLFGEQSGKEQAQRFRAEAAAAASLQHPNIVAIHEVNAHEGQPFFVMDFIEGQNLAKLSAECEMRNADWLRRAARWVKTVADAIHFAHERGILHRDLKPSNVLIDPFDQPRVTDFGLAKRLHHDSELTLSGQVLGSPNYMPPEQAAAKRGLVGRRSDVYSLGAILYHLLTGRPPFVGETLTDTLQDVVNNEPVSPRLLNPGVPCDLETLCLKCLEKEPARRYQTALALAEDLGRFLEAEPIAARPVSNPERLWRWCRRKPGLAAAIVALLVVAVVGVTGILWQWNHAKANAEQARRQSVRAEESAARETAQRQLAEQAVTMLELQRAEDLLEKDETVMGVAYLARIVRQNPTNHIAARRLVSCLTQRDFAIPIGPPLPHGNRINHAEFSPDGSRIATASIDLTARLWDARTGLPIGEPLRHSNAVRYAHFSPDSQRLVTVSDSASALLWDIASGHPIGQPLRHEKWVRSAQFSPDGRQLVTASDDQTARLWDAHTGEALAASLPHAGPVRSAGFSPNSRWIVTISGNTAFLWDADSGQPVGKPLSHTDNLNIEGFILNTARFSPNSQWIVTASDNSSARVWEVATGKPITGSLLHKGSVIEAEFSPDGRRVVTAADDGAAHVLDALTGQPLTAPLSHGGRMSNARFSPDGQRMITLLNDNAVRLREVRSDRLLAAPLPHDGYISGASFSPDWQFVVTFSRATAQIWDIRPGRAFDLILNCGAQINSVHFSPDGEWLATASTAAEVWDARTGRPRTPPLPHPGGTYPARFSPDGQRILTGSWDGTARLWDARTGQPLCEPLRHDGKVNWIEFSPDGKWFLTLSGNKALRVWDAHTGQLRSELPWPGILSSVAHFSPDSQSVVFGVFDDDSVRVVDINSGKTRVELRGHGKWIINMQFSFDGRRIATASADGTARIWDAATGAPMTPPLVHNSPIDYAEFSPDGLLVVTASRDDTAQVWDTSTGRALTEPLRHRGPVSEASFSPDSQQVLTSSLDSTVRLWDSHTGRPLAEPIRHADSVWHSSFSPDGQWAATASRDGTAHIWELPPATTVDKHDRSTGLFLAELAEAVIGQRLGEIGDIQPVSSMRLTKLREELSRHAPSTNAFTRWLGWFLADRSTRTISPNSPITVPEYVEHRLEARTLAAASEAVLIAPTNAPALAQLAEMLLTASGSNAPVVVAEAEFLIHRAETISPNDDRVQSSRRRIELQLDRRSPR